MFNTIINNWHIWQGTGDQILMSYEGCGPLGYHAGIDDAVNWLWLKADDRTAARALHAAYKAHKARWA